MELWIRSQDKMDIMKVESLHIDEIPTFNDVNIICYTSGNKYSNIGHYKNKKRALEVLDEIQKYMLNGSFAKITNGLGEIIELKPNPIFVYEMPKE